jgi:hypothetical protein
MPIKMFLIYVCVCACVRVRPIKILLLSVMSKSRLEYYDNGATTLSTITLSITTLGTVGGILTISITKIRIATLPHIDTQHGNSQYRRRQIVC